MWIHRHKLVKATQGAISLLLAMLLLPFYSIAAVLVESLRYQSAIRTLDEALGTASLSVLADYDAYMRNRFGLMAVSQKGGDDAIEDSLKKYMGKTQLTDLAGIDVNDNTITGTGMYPLADPAVLRRQVEEYAKLLVPSKVVADGLHIDDIIKELEKASGWVGVFSTTASGADTVGAEAEMLMALENAEKSARTVQTTVKKYDAAYDEWKSSVNTLLKHLKTTCPDQESDADGYKKWNDTKKELIETADTAKDAYIAANEGVITSLDALQKEMDDYIKAEGKFAAATEKFVAESESSIFQADHAGDKSYKNMDQAVSAISGAVKNGSNDMSNRINNTLDSFDSGRLTEAVRQLQEQKTALEAFKTEDLTEASFEPDDTIYYKASVQNLADADTLHTLLDESYQELQHSGLLDTISALFSALNNLFKANTIFDPTLNSRLDEAFYRDNYGGLPSRKDRGSGAYSLPDSNQKDEDRSIGFLQEIDPDFDPGNPFKTKNGFDTSLLATIMSDLKGIMDSADSLMHPSDMGAWFSALANICKSIKAMVGHCVQFMGQIVAQIVSLAVDFAYDRLLLNGYLVYTLPNRTNYSSGKTLTGYSFSKIPYGAVPHDLVYKLPGNGGFLPAMISAIANGGGHTNKCFSGAELEYVFWGFNSEIANQALQFFALFIFRALVDIQILANAEVQGIIAASTIAAPVVSVAYILVEALLDTLVLVNGGDTSFLKTKPYSTPSGVGELVDELISLPLTGGTEEKPSGSGNKKEFSFTISDALSFNYTEHTLILMLIFGNEHDYLNHLTDLIQAEGTAYCEKNISLSNRVTGTPETFDVDKSYTVIRASAGGSLNQLLPIPSLSNSTLLHTNRVLYRGY